MTVLELLQATKKRLLDFGWTKGAFARNKSGAVVNQHSDQASCYCLAGAMRASEDTSDHDVRIQTRIDFKKANDIEAKYGLGFGITEWNDSVVKSVDEVILALDKTIEYVSQEGSG